MSDRFDFHLKLVKLKDKICKQLKSYELFCFLWETCELLEAFEKSQPANKCDLDETITLKKKYLIIASKYFDQSFGDQIQSLFSTPKPITCRECGGDIVTDHTKSNMYYCDKCGSILGYNLTHCRREAAIAAA